MKTGITIIVILAAFIVLSIAAGRHANKRHAADPFNCQWHCCPKCCVHECQEQSGD
jgi:hypothetical protein